LASRGMVLGYLRIGGVQGGEDHLRHQGGAGKMSEVAFNTNLIIAQYCLQLLPLLLSTLWGQCLPGHLECRQLPAQFLGYCSSSSDLRSRDIHSWFRLPKTDTGEDHDLVAH
jgi:hypothetical protein